MRARIGIAGLGTVGCGLLSIFGSGSRASCDPSRIIVKGVSARDRSRSRPVPIDGYDWYDDPVELATSPDTDIFVELMGGPEGQARASIEAALKAGKSVVTANKALIAAHGAGLAKLAEDNGAALRFEAAVAGGTPVVHGIGGGLAACRVTSLAGILNGTCNFVLDQMGQHGADYEQAVRDAQEAGFAEADPSLDVYGIDAAQKIAILAMLGFDKVVPGDAAYRVRGISSVQPKDLSFARRLRHAIKLIAEAREVPGGVALRVTPALVPEDHPFAAQQGAGNAVAVEADPLGRLLFTGPGAGAGATAAAVASDILDIARTGPKGPVFTIPIEEMEPMPLADGWALKDRYALRIEADQPEQVADAIRAALTGKGVDVTSFEVGRHEIDILTAEIDERTIFDVTSEMAAPDGLVTTVNYYPILAP